MGGERLYFRTVEFRRFKAFRNYRVDLRDFNVLVGPNNAGKSTVIAAFRILAAAMRKAQSRRAEIVVGPLGPTRGYHIDMRPISVAEENIFFNYDDDEPAFIKFTLSNDFTLTLYFPDRGACNLIADAAGKVIESPSVFKSNFNCQIGFVPILGPVEHNELLYEKEAARLALFNYRAARNFRNIWYHYPELFTEFQNLLRTTWPGMDILPPELEHIDGKTYIYMYCPEKRVPREIFWAGFGFQVWCQMLTHLIQSKDKSIFLVDEPDVYLHSELQRQLLDILRNLGPDIIIATHSTEIITEAAADEIVVVEKDRTRSRRIRNPSSVGGVFNLLGSNLNPVLTQLAKTKRALFVEGKDFHILGRFAHRLGHQRLGNRSDFAVVPLEGFNPEKMKNIKEGMEITLGDSILSATVLDRDFRSDAECAFIKQKCLPHSDFVIIHLAKEIENFLLVPAAIDRAVSRQIEKRLRSTRGVFNAPWAREKLLTFAATKKAYVFSQYVAQTRTFGRSISLGRHETEASEEVLKWLEEQWQNEDVRLSLIPGKEALNYLNSELQETLGLSVNPSAIIEAMKPEEVPNSMQELIELLLRFSLQNVGRSEKRPSNDLAELST